MSLFVNLCETYDENYDETITKEHKGDNIPLLPLYHTVHNAHVEITLDEGGNFLDARLIGLTDLDRLTITPCTEKSDSRTNQLEPHPLFDKLKYLTAECAVQGRTTPIAFEKYHKQLTAWCVSPYCHLGASAVLTYVNKGKILSDLVEARVLIRAEDGSFPAKRPASKRKDKGTPSVCDIFSTCTKDQLDAFVRFQVLFADEEEDSRLWLNPSVWGSWIEYQDSIAPEKEFCCISGTKEVPSSKSPHNIRHVNDRAKLVSSNDSKGYTFLGRFTDASEALCIGRVSTEKAHSALRWLISRQGYRHGDQVVVAWSKHGSLPQLVTAGSDDAVRACLEDGWLEPEDEQEPSEPLTGRDFAWELNRAISGYKNHLEHGERASIVCLNAASQGRLSVTYYRELQAKDLLDRIMSWHDECAWQQSDRKKITPSYAPSPLTIAQAAYGEKVKDELVAKTVDRLLPCIIDGARVPWDLIESAARRASRPASLESREVRQAQFVACSLIRKRCIDDQRFTERITMENAKDLPGRDVAFGRLLAFMRRIEEVSLYRADKENRRITHAERYQERYVSRPATTLQMLMDRLRPHLGRLNVQGSGWYEMDMLEIMGKLTPADMTNKPLGPLYLIGYASQYNTLRFPKDKADETREEEEPLAEDD